MATKVNTKTMLKYEDINEDIVIEKDGHAYSEDGTLLMKKPTGIYSDVKASVDDIFDTKTRIKGNDAILYLDNGKTITIKNYFKNNGKSSFANIMFTDSEGFVNASTNILSEGLLTNKNLYNEYNLANNHSENGTITKTTIQGTVFNDIVDLSEFDADQLVDAKGKALKSLTIKTDKGNDNITGSILNDNITGGEGENTLSYDAYKPVSGKGNKQTYGNDIYNTTKGEILNLVYGADRDLEYSKVGNDIVIKETSRNDVVYTREEISGDTIATEYTKVKVISCDTTAMKFTREVVEANDIAETEGEYAGKFKKVVKHYEVEIKDGELEWKKVGKDTTTYEESAVKAEEKYYQSVNGAEEKEYDFISDGDILSKEGKFNAKLSISKRNDDNTDWAEGEETDDIVKATVTGDTIYKSVNGKDKVEYTETGDEHEYEDNGKFNQTVIGYERNEDNTDWEETSRIPSLEDSAVEASDKIYRSEDGAPKSFYEDADKWNEEELPADMAGTTVDLGSVTIKNLGKDNTLIDANVDGKNLFEAAEKILIDGTKGGKIQGTIGKDEITLGAKDATISSVVNDDVVITGTGAVTFTMSDSMQDLVDTDLYKITSSGNSLTVDDIDRNSSLTVDYTVDPKSVSVVDSTKAKYNVTMADEAELTTKGNNLVFSESTTGTTIKTGTGNDVVVLNDSPTTTEDVTNEYLADSAYTVNEDKATISRAITAEDLNKVEGYEYAEGKYSRDVVAADLKDDTLEFVDASHVSQKLTSADLKLGEGETYQVKDGKGRVVKDGAEDRTLEQKDLKEGSLLKVDENGLVDYRETTSTDLKEETGYVYAEGKYSRDVVAADLTQATTDAGLSLDGTTKLKKDIKKEDLLLADNQAYDEVSHQISSSYLNTISYTGGKDAYLGSKTADEYDITVMNNKTVVSINDLGGADILKFTNQNFKDMTIFFDYNKDSKLEDVTDLAFISDSAIKANKFTTGGVLLQNYFDGKEAGGDGAGKIENIFVAGGVDAVDMTSRINAIKDNVVAWFANNGNYDSAMEVLESGNNADIQSLMQCYAAGSTL